MQRRFKTEPYDVYLYHQDASSTAEIIALHPAAIIIARRFGYPSTENTFIEAFHAQASLRVVPILLSLTETMLVPKPQPNLTVVMNKADDSDDYEIINTLHRLLEPQPQF
jgi:hypothetical protein